MVQKYAALWINILLLIILFFVSNIQIVDGSYSFFKKSSTQPGHGNIFYVLEKPIVSLLAIKNTLTPVFKAFYEWHEHVFYFAVDENQKKMFLSARILTALIPWVIIGIVMYTNPYITQYVWNINYASISALPSNITPSFIAQKIGKLSSFNQNCIMIGAEKGLQWVISRKIAPDICINPATWFTDKANHDFINTITSICIIILSWIYILYCVYLNSNSHHKNLIKIIVFQICIRYALYLTSLKNNIHTFLLSDHLHNYTKTTQDQISLAHLAMQKELHNSIKNIHLTLKQLITLAEKTA